MLDIVGNMTQIASWTLKGFHREEERIALFLKLTRKDVNQLTRFPLPAPFVPIFNKFCKAYDDMEAEYKKGIKDHRVWAGQMQTWAKDLAKNSNLV